MIQIQKTPNINSLKFIPDDPIISSDSFFNFVKDKENLHQSPLVNVLFEIEGVEEVLISKSFIAIIKNNDIEWNIIKPIILGAMIEHFIHKIPVIIDQDNPNRDRDYSDHTKEESIIVSIIDNEIAPLVARDGGNIEFIKYENNIVYVNMSGSCSGCASSTVTLKLVVYSRLKAALPGLKDVIAEGVDSEYFENEINFIS